jgi:DNA-binding CsgD family transcriptional regulator/tetratricopeptide (TPR) repeat protein
MVRLVGREPELRKLRAIAERTRSGVNAVVTIDGESGIGKTTLLAALREQLASEGWMVLDCRCAEFDSDRPFSPLIAALDELTHSAGSVAPIELADAAAMVKQPQTSLDAQHSGDRLRCLIVEGIHDLAKVVPVLVMFDDAQWLDDATAQVLWAITRRNRRNAILTVSAFAPSVRDSVQILRRGLDSDRASTLILNPLTNAEAEELGELTLGKPLTNRTRELVRSTGGVPLLVTELLSDEKLDASSPENGSRHGSGDDSADDSGDDFRDGLQGMLSVPMGLTALVMRRLAGLPTLTRNLLDDASLLGREFRLDELAALHQLDLDAAVSVLTPALELRILVSRSSTIAFQHGLIQHIVANNIPELVRKRRHRQLALALADLGADSVRVAEQHWSSAPLFDEQAAAVMQQAASDVQRLSLEAALVWAERAVSALPLGTSRFDLQMQRANLYVLLGQAADAELICDEPATVPTTTDDHIRLLGTRTALATMSGRSRQDEGMKSLDEMLTLIGENDPRYIETLGWKALLFVFRGDLVQARECANEAIRLAGTVDMPSMLCRPYEALGLSSLLAGDSHEAQRYTAIALELFSDHRNVLADVMMPHFARAMTLLATRPIEEAIDVLQQGCAVCDKAGHLMARLHLEPLLSISYFARGDMLIARASAEFTLERNKDWRARGVALPTATGLAAYTSMLFGDMETARTLAERALEELFEAGAQATSADFAVWCIAGVAEADGQIDRARDLLTGVWELFAKEASLFTIAPDLVRLTRLERPEFATEVVERAEARAQRSGTPLDQAHALSTRGLLEQRVELLDQAAYAFDEIHWLFPATRTRAFALDIALAQAQVQSQPTETESLPAINDAKRRLTDVLSGWELMETNQPVQVLKTRFAGSTLANVKGRSRRPTKGPEALSRAERAVVELVGQGLTNKEIAQQLFVSHRTVETHVSHALSKLDATTRLQLAKFALQNSR